MFYIAKQLLDWMNRRNRRSRYVLIYPNRVESNLRDSKRKIRELDSSGDSDTNSTHTGEVASMNKVQQNRGVDQENSRLSDVLIIESQIKANERVEGL